MRRLICFFLLLQSACIFSFASETFFHQYPDAGKDLPEELFYPRGRRFLFTGFSPHPSRLEELAKAGFSALGPVYNQHEKFYSCCRKLNMPYLFTVKAEGITLNRLSSREPLDWPKIEEEIRSKVRAASSDRMIACWYLQPEELRFWRKNEYRYFKMAAEIIRSTDPLKRPVWSYLPGHYLQDGLAKYAPSLDILGKGMYVNYAGHKHSRVWVRYSAEAQIGAIRDSGASAIPLSVPEMFQEPAADEVAKIPTWVRHDVYCSLINGNKGVVIFSLWPRPKFPSWQKYYDSYLQVASEIKKLGTVFLFGHECSDLSMKIISGPPETSCLVRYGKKTENRKYPSVSWRNLSYLGKRYLFAVNSAESAVTAEWSGFPDRKLQVMDCRDGNRLETIGQKKIVLNFDPLEVKLLEFVRTK